MRVEVERPAEPALRRRVVTETALDHRAVEELRRIERAQPERTPRQAERLATPAVARQRPGQDVVAVDRRTLGPRRPRERNRSSQSNSVVDVEERRLQVDLDAVRPLQLRDRPDERVLAFCGFAAEQVSERRDELRQRHHGRRLARKCNRMCVATARRLDQRERLERMDVTRPHSQRCAVLTRGFAYPAVRPEELAELGVRPRERVGLARGRVDGELHRPRGAGNIPK